MRASLSVATALIGAAAALPKIPFVSSTETVPGAPAVVYTRQSNQNACFLIGDETLPGEVADIAAALAPVVTCDNSATTLSNVPDVTSGSTTFSSIDFSQSSQTALEFALDKFATAQSLADTDLATFQDMLNVYQATEAGIRSVGGGLAIKVPKFFLEMQVSRIQTAQGNPPTAAGLQVDHLRDKVLKNAPKEAKALLNQVTQLATQLS